VRSACVSVPDLVLRGLRLSPQNPRTVRAQPDLESVRACNIFFTDVCHLAFLAWASGLTPLNRRLPTRRTPSCRAELVNELPERDARPSSAMAMRARRRWSSLRRHSRRVPLPVGRSFRRSTQRHPRWLTVARKGVRTAATSREGEISKGFWSISALKTDSDVPRFCGLWSRATSRTPPHVGYRRCPQVSVGFS